MSEFKKDRYVIRPLLRKDLAQVLVWRNHPDIRRYMYTQHIITELEHFTWYHNSLLDSKKKLLIFEVENQPQGFVNFTETDVSGVSNWGFYLAPNAPPKTGYQLGQAAIDYAFQKLKLRKICGQVLMFNQRSIRFHLSLGFQRVEPFSNNPPNAKLFNEVVYFSLLLNEWCAHNAAVKKYE